MVKKKSMLFYIRLMALHRKCQKSIALNVAITDVCCCIKNLNNKTYSCAEVVFIFDKLIQNSSWKRKQTRVTQVDVNWVYLWCYYLWKSDKYPLIIHLSLYDSFINNDQNGSNLLFDPVFI